MAIPEYQAVMAPALEVCADRSEHRKKHIQEVLAEHFKLADDELTRMLPSGRQTVFSSRVGWALTYLVRAGLLERPSRGIYRITDRGLEAIGTDRPVNNEYLSQYPEFVAFRGARPREEPAAGGDSADEAQRPDTESETPEELMERARAQLRSALRAELLESVKSQTPEFFEALVLDVLVAIGYGGDREDAAQRLGRSGDEGVDGVIREDRLGLDKIYVQAKRYAEWRVGRPEVQGFVGALHGKQVAKGVFMTTATFTPDALDYVRSIADNVVLIDGQQLADLMMDHGVGVTTRQTYDLKAIDQDYFLAEESS